MSVLSCSGGRSNQMFYLKWKQKTASEKQLPTTDDKSMSLFTHLVQYGDIKADASLTGPPVSLQRFRATEFHSEN